MKYGYARCSTNDTMQDIDRQIRELKAAGAETIRSEYVHGTDDKKPEQERLLAEVQQGDTIIITEVSRLSRSVQQLCKLIDLVEEKQLCLQILNSVTVDCRNGSIDPMTKAFLQMAGVFAELERNMISERVKSGMANAAAKGSKAGRHHTTIDDVPENVLRHYPAYKAGSYTVVEFARLCDISRPTAYKYIRLLETA